MIAHPRQTSLLAAVLFGVALSFGCADSMTYSRDARRHGVELYNDGQYAEAAGAFKNSARQNPRDYRNYYYLGACYEQMGQYQQAVHSYRTALATLNISLAAKTDDEFRLRIVNGLGRSIARSDHRDTETDDAVGDANKTPTAENWFIVAKIYAFRGDADSAIDAYNRASLLDPKSFMILKDYGLYLNQMGQVDAAQAPLRRAYALNPDDDQINEALRRTGVVPGPSLKDRNALAKPHVPKGPIPELELNFDFLKGKSRDNPDVSTSDTTVEAPRD